MEKIGVVNISTNYWKIVMQICVNISIAAIIKLFCKVLISTVFVGVSCMECKFLKWYANADNSIV